MKCYYVLVHGRLSWATPSPLTSDSSDSFQPAGFYCHRHVLASTAKSAQEKAFRRVRDNLDRQTGWLSGNLTTLEMEADEIAPAPVFQLLKPENRGHTFYEG